MATKKTTTKTATETKATKGKATTSKAKKNTEPEVVEDLKMSTAEKLKIANALITKMTTADKGLILGFASNPIINKELTVEFIKFPSYRLSEICGGGIPRGRITQITGDQDSGKTSILLETIGKEMQKDPRFVAMWLESEKSLNTDHLEMFGIDRDRFIYLELSDVGAGEVAIDKVRAVAKTGILDMIVINSIKALTPSKEFSNDMDSQTVGLQARFVARIMRVFTAIVARHKTAFVCVNHLTTDIGVMFGDNLKAACGRAIGYSSILTLDFRKKVIQMDKDPIVGEKEDFLKIGVTVKKNHVMVKRNPYMKCDYFVQYGKGTDVSGEILQSAVDAGILSSSGAWTYEYDANGDVRALPDGTMAKWNGKKALKTYIDNAPDYLKYLEERVAGNISVQSIQTEEEVQAIIDEENKGRDFYKEHLEEYVENEMEKELEKELTEIMGE